MTDINLLESNAADVKAGLTGLDAASLADLLAAEKAGKNRKGVIADIEDAQRALDADATADPAHETAAIKTLTENDPPAEISPAETFDPSGAPVQIVPDVVPNHPSVDNNPRANTTETMNRIDFNEPLRDDVDVVTEQLGAKPAE